MNETFTARQIEIPAQAAGGLELKMGLAGEGYFKTRGLPGKVAPGMETIL